MENIYSAMTIVYLLFMSSMGGMDNNGEKLEKSSTISEFIQTVDTCFDQLRQDPSHVACKEQFLNDYNLLRLLGGLPIATSLPEVDAAWLVEIKVKLSRAYPASEPMPNIKNMETCLRQLMAAPSQECEAQFLTSYNVLRTIGGLPTITSLRQFDAGWLASLGFKIYGKSFIHSLP